MLTKILGDSTISITQMTEYLHPLRALFQKCFKVFTAEEVIAMERLVLDRMICPWWSVPVLDREILEAVVNRAGRGVEAWEKIVPLVRQRRGCGDKEEMAVHCTEAWNRLDEAEEVRRDVERLRWFLTM